MSLGIRSEEGPFEASDSSLSSREGVGRADVAVPTSFRENYIQRRNTVIGELSKCYEEGFLLGQILPVLPIIEDLPNTFQFADALAYQAAGVAEDEAPIVSVLKSKMAKNIQEPAAKAAQHCDSPQAKSRFLGVLERKYKAELKELIEAERKGCADKIEGLCSRLEQVYETLVTDFLSQDDNNLQDLRRATLSLRAYASRYFGVSPASSTKIEFVSAHPGTPPQAVSLKDFFDRLNSGTVELLRTISDKHAA
jgi:hypothetical protein